MKVQKILCGLCWGTIIGLGLAYPPTRYEVATVIGSVALVAFIIWTAVLLDE